MPSTALAVRNERGISIARVVTMTRICKPIELANWAPNLQTRSTATSLQTRADESADSRALTPLGLCATSSTGSANSAEEGLATYHVAHHGGARGYETGAQAD